LPDSPPSSPSCRSSPWSAQASGFSAPDILRGWNQGYWGQFLNGFIHKCPSYVHIKQQLELAYVHTGYIGHKKVFCL
jgi:hypothetical protein